LSPHAKAKAKDKAKAVKGPKGSKGFKGFKGREMGGGWIGAKSSGWIGGTASSLAQDATVAEVGGGYLFLGCGHPPPYIHAMGCFKLLPGIALVIT